MLDGPRDVLDDIDRSNLVQRSFILLEIGAGAVDTMDLITGMDEITRLPESYRSIAAGEVINTALGWHRQMERIKSL